MEWQQFKRRIAESAIEFALTSFWIAAGGTALSIATAVFFFLRSGASPYFLGGLFGAAIAFAFVLITTAAVVILYRRGTRKAHLVRGRKGFLDYKLQGLRALTRMNKCMVDMTRQMNRIAKETLAGAKRTSGAYRGFGNRDERGYRAMQRTARRLDRRAAALKLHADSFATDTALCIEGTGKWLDWVLSSGPTNRSELRSFTNSLQGMHDAMAANVPVMEGFHASINETRQTSESLDLAGAALQAAVSTMISSTMDVVSFADAQLKRLRG